MSQLTIFADSAPDSPLERTDNPDRIAEVLRDAGVRFEQWDTRHNPGADASQDEVIEAFRDHVDRLMREGDYQTLDVISMHPGHPEAAALREKFLDEHSHGEDEVRFFVDGRGLFSLHIGERVYEVLCERNDLISVPAGTPHWFDMGPEPAFTAIRLFNNPEGWVAHYTGSDIAHRFSRLD